MNHNSFRSLGAALALTLGACGPGQNDDATSGAGGGGASGGAAGSGGPGPAGGAGAAPPETGSASSSGRSGGATPTGGTGPSGGSSSGGGPGATTGGASGSGGAPGGDCTRELLDGLLDDYFAALAAGDPSSLPLAEGVKFTENAMQAEIGTTDFWRNAG